MCLGIPMQVMSCDGLMAQCAAKGISRDVSLFLIQHEPIAPGDHVMVHVGYAIQKMTQAEAQSSWELLDELARMDGMADEPGAGFVDRADA